jgi:hypothetical protein
LAKANVVVQYGQDPAPDHRSLIDEIRKNLEAAAAAETVAPTTPVTLAPQRAVHAAPL